MTSEQEFQDIIKTKTQEFVDSYNTKNFEKMNSFHAQDCLYMPPGAPAERGNKGNDEILQMFQAQGFVRINITNQEICGPYNDDTGVVWSKFAFYSADGEVKLQGKSMMKWKKYSDDWKVEWDIFNSDMPLGPPPTS